MMAFVAPGSNHLPIPDQGPHNAEWQPSSAAKQVVEMFKDPNYEKELETLKTTHLEKSEIQDLKLFNEIKSKHRSLIKFDLERCLLMRYETIHDPKGVFKENLIDMINLLTSPEAHSAVPTAGPVADPSSLSGSASIREPAPAAPDSIQKSLADAMGTHHESIQKVNAFFKNPNKATFSTLATCMENMTARMKDAYDRFDRGNKDFKSYKQNISDFYIEIEQIEKEIHLLEELLLKELLSLDEKKRSSLCTKVIKFLEKPTHKNQNEEYLELSLRKMISTFPNIEVERPSTRPIVMRLETFKQKVKIYKPSLGDPDLTQAELQNKIKQDFEPKFQQNLKAIFEKINPVPLTQKPINQLEIDKSKEKIDLTLQLLRGSKDYFDFVKSIITNCSFDEQKVFSQLINSLIPFRDVKEVFNTLKDSGTQPDDKTTVFNALINKLTLEQCYTLASTTNVLDHFSLEDTQLYDLYDLAHDKGNEDLKRTIAEKIEKKVKFATTMDDKAFAVLSLHYNYSPENADYFISSLKGKTSLTVKMNKKFMLFFNYKSTLMPTFLLDMLHDSKTKNTDELYSAFGEIYIRQFDIIKQANKLREEMKRYPKGVDSVSGKITGTEINSSWSSKSRSRSRDGQLIRYFAQPNIGIPSFATIPPHDLLSSALPRNKAADTRALPRRDSVLARLIREGLLEGPKYSGSDVAVEI